MTDTDTARLRELHVAAGHCCDTPEELFDAIPAMCDEVDRLRARVQAVRTLSTEVGNPFRSDLLRALGEA